MAHAPLRDGAWPASSDSTIVWAGLQQHLQAEAATLQQRVDDLHTALTHSARLDTLKRWLNRRLAAQA